MQVTDPVVQGIESYGHIHIDGKAVFIQYIHGLLPLLFPDIVFKKFIPGSYGLQSRRPDIILVQYPGDGPENDPSFPRFDHIEHPAAKYQ
jgi:hypothetical protein